MKPQNGVFCNVMPCILSDDGVVTYGGTKIVTRYPDRNPSLDSKILLFNAQNGDFLALMDANWITAMRTGAVATNAIMLLAKKNFKTISIMGLGNTARATLMVLMSQIGHRKLHVKLLRYKEQENLFVKRFAEFRNIEFEFVDNTRDLAKGTDVLISCVTYLDDNVCHDEDFDEGVLVLPVHTRGFLNCDLFFDKVYSDDTAHIRNFVNFDKFRNYSEITDAINGKSKGRENDRERIIAYCIGVSTHDINYAGKIFERISNNCKDIFLKEPNEKFWV